MEFAEAILSVHVFLVMKEFFVIHITALDTKTHRRVLVEDNVLRQIHVCVTMILNGLVRDVTHHFAMESDLITH